MASAIINGRRVEIPDVATVEDIRKAGEIETGRHIVRSGYEKSHLLKPDETVRVADDDKFDEVPGHIKGIHQGVSGLVIPSVFRRG